MPLELAINFFFGKTPQAQATKAKIVKCHYIKLVNSLNIYIFTI